MIIKAGKSRKSARYSSIKSLIDYVFDPAKMKDNVHGRSPVVVKRLLEGYDQEKWIGQFIANDQKRNYEHKRRAVLRHEFISFSGDDNKHLTEDVIRKFAQEYLKMRSPMSMGCATMHYDSESNPHLHFILSGVGIDSEPTRISKNEFAKFKRSFQDEFQREHFPELVSIVEHGKNREQKKLRLGHEEKQMLKRGVAPDKVKLSVALHKLADHCRDMNELTKRLQDEFGLEVYYRNSGFSPTGVFFNGRKLRWKTLGISNDLIQELSLKKEQFKDDSLWRNKE